MMMILRNLPILTCLFENRLIGDQAAAFKEGITAAEKAQGEAE